MEHSLSAQVILQTIVYIEKAEVEFLDFLKPDLCDWLSEQLGFGITLQFLIFCTKLLRPKNIKYNMNIIKFFEY